MLHKRADRPQVELPREDRAPGPSGGARAHPHAPPPDPSHYQWTRAAGACSCLPSGQDVRSSGSFCLGPFPLSPGAPHGGDTQVRVGSGPRRQAAVASPGWGLLGQWVAMATPQALPQGPLGSRKGPLSLPPRGSPTLALRSFHPRPTKQGFGTDCLPGSEALVVNMQQGLCSQGAYNLWWRRRKTDKQDDLEHRMS